MNKKYALLIALSLLAAAVVVAHPHMSKSIKATLPGGQEATITYSTVPSNESHVAKAPAGGFLNPHNARFNLSADVKAGDITIPAGDYMIGVVKNSEKDFTLVLHPGPFQAGKPDMSKLIKLDSMFLESQGKAAHLLIDISPGEGKFQNRAMLTLHFGSLFLGGALS